MYTENPRIKEASVQLEKAFSDEHATPEAIQTAFESLASSIAETVREDFVQANGDKNILAQRGFRVLTSAEQKYYETIIEAGKSSNPKQAYAGLATDNGVMPVTIIEDVYRELVEDHPLLSRINFVSVEYLTRWILNDHTAQTAVWGEVNAEITGLIESAFKTVEMAQCKLSAYAVIEKDMLDLGPVFLDNYIRTFLKESVMKALEKAIVCGSGHNQPIGLDRDVHKGVNVNSSTGYPQKTPETLASFQPKDYGALLAKLAKTEKYYTADATGEVAAKTTACNSNGTVKSGYTAHGGRIRAFDQVTLICNQIDYLTKIMPASTAMTALGTYVNNVFPFPTEVIRSNEVEEGKCIIALPEEYFLGLGSSKDGVLEYSDDFKFLEDKRTFKIKLHGNGMPYDDTVAVLVDISEIDPAYVVVENKSPINVTVNVPEDESDAGSGSGAGGSGGSQG